MNVRRHFRIAVLSGVVWGCAAGTPLASEPTIEDVRQAVARGEIRPLSSIKEAMRGKLPGEIVGTDLERKDGKWVYEFRTIDGSGNLLDVYVDAASGEVIQHVEK